MHEFSNGTTAQDIDRRLWLELSDEQYRLVRELVRLEADAPIIGLITETDRVVMALAERFPSISTEIRAYAQRVIEYGAIYEDGGAAESVPYGRWRPGPDFQP